MTETYIEPTITRRAQLTHTLKDGWRVAEISITVTGEPAEGAILTDMSGLILATYEEAEDGIRRIVN